MRITRDDVLDRFHGCMVGLALGDSCGFPLEMKGPEECREGAVAALLSGDAIPARDGYAFGQWSDDTQQALILARTIVEDGFSARSFANRLALFHHLGLDGGWGGNTKSAAERIYDGASWSEAIPGEPAQTNGAAMRVAPLALAYRGIDTNRLSRMARNQAIATHGDGVAADAAVVTAHAVCVALESGKALDPERFLGDIYHRCDIDGMAVPMRLAFFTVLDIVDGRCDFMDMHELDPRQDPKWKCISPFAPTTVGWAIASFLKHPDSYADAVTMAISCGGDVDTTAAITGALSGARVGLGGLPEAHIDLLHDGDREDVTSLLHVASQLYHRRRYYLPMTES